MLRSVALLLWIALSVPPALSQPLRVNSDCPATFFWRESQAGAWQRFGPPELATSALLERDREVGQVDIRCVGAGLFLRRVGARQKVAHSLPEIDIETAVEPNIIPLGAALVISLIGLGGAVVGLVRRSARRTLQEATEKFETVLESRNVATLFRTDGSLPEEIGGYRVRRLLGIGGMAMVYEVEAPDGHPCALKLPLPQFGNDPEFRRRFAREMRVSSQLLHPNVVRIEYVQMAAGEGEYPYYVMELVRGSSWESRLEEAPPDASTVLRWTRGVLQGLEHVHARNLVHRDIKPANIVISSSGLAKLMDFGIAKDLVADTMLTRPDQAVGTPAYMAPEQLTGKPVGPAADLYAVGLVVYRSLAGRLPFEEEDLPTILSLKLSGQELPPLERLDLPSELTDWVMRMVAVDPARRFASAAEARLALERIRL